MVMNTDDQLITIIDQLTNAVNVCYAAANASYEERRRKITNLSIPLLLVILAVQ